MDRFGFAAAAGRGFTQHWPQFEQARLVGGSAGQQRAGAAVRDAHCGTRHRRGIAERGDPDQRAFAAPFEMDRHIGDQGPRRDIARHRPPQQRCTQRRAGELNHVKALGPQRHPDHFEELALARQRNFHRGAGAGACSGQQRLFAGAVDRELGAVLALDPLVVAALGLIEPAQPVGHFGIAGLEPDHLPHHMAGLADQIGLDRAHGDRQRRAFAGLDDPEGAGELDQRRGGREADRQREARQVGKRAARQVLDPGGHDHAGPHCGGERPVEIDVRNFRIVLLVRIRTRLPLGPVGQLQPDAERLAALDRGRESHVDRSDRVTGSLAV